MFRATLFAVLTLVLAIPAFGQRPRDRSKAWEQPSVLRTSGMATVKAPPDEARISIGVVTAARTAEEAGAQNARQVEQVLAALRKELGEAGEIQTQNYSIHPEYNYPVLEFGMAEFSCYVSV
jgi:uncharacterized protein YggE